MGFSISPSPIYFPSRIRFLCHHKFKFSPNPILFRRKSPRPFSISASIAQEDLHFSWLSSDQNAPDEFNGWEVVETPVKEKKNKKGSILSLKRATLVMIGAAASVALVGVIAYISLSKKGFPLRFSSQINAIQRVFVPSKIEEEGVGSESVDPDITTENAEVSKGSDEVVSDSVDGYIGKVRGQLERIIVPIAVDSTQQDALSVLKELKIIEDDVKADELCTRREYARWLVRANSQLERSRKHRIVPSVALSGSKVAAFDDVSIEDPDFEHIQSLAEAGIIPSKLSGGNSASDPYNSEGGKGFNFFPERFISRQDLISWKAKLEYGVMPGIDEEISRRNIGVLDVREINSDAIVDFFLDLQADERSILRRTFGQSKRFQPRKPCTKAQAVVALTSGRMAEFMSAELARTEAENASRKIAMHEIRSELLEKGDIQQFWDRKMEIERSRGLSVEEAYLVAVSDLEQEKIVEENFVAELLKQKAALDCQKQLLSSLKREVDEMSERLTTEKAKYIDEQSNVNALLSDLQVKYEGLIDAKSILEAEIEALRILRSWVEEEARKSQARAKVLEDVERRWKWYKNSHEP